jgi:hypothetical protein
MTVPHLFALAATGAVADGINDPSDIADLTLWLDASDTGTITESGGAVSQWDDKSADGRDYTQASAGAKPTTGATTQNGLNVLDFDGGDYLSRGSAWMKDATQSFGLTVFAVVQRDSGASQDLLTEGSTGSATPFYRLCFSASNVQQFIRRTDGNAIATYSSTEDINDTAWHRTTWRFNAGITALDMFVDDVLGYDAAISLGGSTTVNTNTVGAIQRTTVSNFWIGSIAEIVAYDRELTAGEISDVEAYLSAKWGV